MTPALFAAVAANAAERVAPGPDARHRLDDRRRRPRLPRRRHAGYRPRTRGDRARALRGRGTRAVNEHRRTGHAGARPLRACRRRHGHAVQRLREPHLPDRDPTATARTPCGSTAPATARRPDRVRAAVGRRAARGRRRRTRRPRSPATDGGGARRRRSAAHNVVLFEWLPGIAPEPDGDDLARPASSTLGAISARMHAHARAWTPARRLRPARTGTTTHTLGRARPLGRAGRTAWAWGPRSARCWSGSTRRSRPRLRALRRRARAASGSCTPTSAWPTCSWTAARCG